MQQTFRLYRCSLKCYVTKSSGNAVSFLAHMPTTKQKRVRRDDPPGRPTLHNFFAGTNVATTPLCRKSQKSGITHSGKSKTIVHPVKQEVIIIDSDSDDAIEIIEGTSSCLKRRRLSPVNFNSATNGIHSVSQEGAAKKYSISFGKPFLLCPELPDGDSECDKRPVSAFSTISLAAETSNTEAGPSAIPEVDIDLTLDDWENGNDEIGRNSECEYLRGTGNPVVLEETPPLNDINENWDIVRQFFYPCLPLLMPSNSNFLLMTMTPFWKIMKCKCLSRKLFSHFQKRL